MVEYRKDIQSLRGICLICVFFYHYNKYILPTGFIGVDIFFYISGYVNTISFLSKIDKSRILFYFNRLKRLFPMSHLVLFVSIIMVKRMNILYQNKQYIDIVYSLFSISNYRYIFLAVDYLSQSEASSLILHYWSLAVEDQFYLFYPFYILTLYNNNILLISVLILSFIYSWYINYKQHYISYFSILSRLWQLLIGVVSNKINKPFKISFNNEFLLIFIIIFCFTIKTDIYFPSPLSIIPLFIICLIITSKNKSFILDIEILIELGNISYCFYLFHYLILFQNREEKKNLSSFILILFTTVIISYIFNVWYENPIKKSSNKIIIFTVYILSLSAMLVICFIFINANNNIMKIKYKLINQNNTTVSNITTLESNCDKYCHIESKNILYSPNEIKKVWESFIKSQCYCPFYSKSDILMMNTFPIVLLLTDSHGEQWFNTIIPYARKMNYLAVYIIFWEDTIYNRDFNNLYKIFNIIPKVKYIVSSHRLYGKGDYNTFKLNYFSYLDILLNHCDIIYIIHDTPHFDKSPNLCLLSTSNYENCFAYLGKNATALKFPIYSSKRVHYVDMIPYICLNSSKCYYIWNSIPIYLDNNHLSFPFTKTLQRIILQHIIFVKQKRRINVKCKYSFKCKYSDIF